MSDPWQNADRDGVAGEKRFSHPFDAEFFERHAPRTARVLDVGCGYGRTLAASS